MTLPMVALITLKKGIYAYTAVALTGCVTCIVSSRRHSAVSFACGVVSYLIGWKYITWTLGKTIIARAISCYWMKLSTMGQTPNFNRVLWTDVSVDRG